MGEKQQENPFTSYYGRFMHQQNMLQDYVRTSTYHRAILENSIDFRGKVVLDVGTGTGILAFFAAQAGAKKVYAVEASSMADIAQQLVYGNDLGSVIQVIKAKMEDVQLPEKVDIIISEPIGFMLVHERMLETYIDARDAWLKPGTGIMMPSTATMFFCPFTDETLFQDQQNKSIFWQNQDFFGVNLSAIAPLAHCEYLSQPIVGNYSTSSLLSDRRVTHHVNFLTVTKEQLQQFEVPFSFVITKTAIMHGLACWFDASFNGSNSIVVLSTAPDSFHTHWYQCRLLIPNPIAVNPTQVITGSLKFEANEFFSYYLTLTMRLEGTNIQSTNRINLHDQCYYYLSHPNPEN